MTTDYRNSVPSSFRATRSEQVPTLEEVTRSIGVYNLTATVEEDTETLSTFRHVPGLIAFICTLKKGNDVIGIGRGTATLNRMSKYVDRAVCYAFNASLIDAMVRSTKTLDAIYLNSTSQRETYSSNQNTQSEEPVLEKENSPKYASEKQRNFLKKLVSTKCKDQTKMDYEHKLESPYLSSFECSALIKNLLTK
jgi:hypothetical protein